MGQQRNTIPAVLAIALPLALACGGDGGTGPGTGGNVDAGRFNVQLSGSFSQTLSGPAFYFQGADGFTISMSSDAQGSGGIGVVLARKNSSLPGVGKYAVVDGTSDQLTAEDFIAASFWASGGTTIQCFSGNGGTVNITESSANVVGDFTTDVGCLDPGDGQVKPATITGAFNAKVGPSE